MTKLIIVDDHRLIVEGLTSLFDSNDTIKVIGTASNGKYALKLIQKDRPNIVLMDINMPVMDGIECTKQINKLFPEVVVLALSMYDEGRLVKRMMKAGAKGFLLKNSSADKIEAAIDIVMSGSTYLDPNLLERVFDVRSKNHSAFSKADELTSRELEIIKLISQELTTNDIANELCISPHTVESHRANIFLKLGVQNTVGLVKWAVKNAIIDL